MLYGRGGCHLCESMAEALHSIGVAFEKVDVDADPLLAARFGARVPVLADGGGTEICHGRVEVRALRARLGLE